MFSLLEYKKNRNFYKMLISIGIPIAIQNLISSSFALVDNIMLGQLSEKYIAAAGLANEMTFIFILICFGAASGGAIFIAQFWGSKQVDKIRQVVSASSMVAGAIAIGFVMAALLIPEAVMSMMTKDPEVRLLGTRYLRIISPTYLLMALSFPSGFAARSVGMPKMVMYSSIIGIALNTLLNYILIFGNFGAPSLGIEGAAIATLISKTLEVALLFGLIKRNIPMIIPRLSSVFKIDKEIWNGFFKKSLPVMVHEGLWSLGTTISVLIYSAISTEAVSAAIISVTFVRFFSVLSTGIGSAGAVILGNTLGEGDVKKAVIYNKKILSINVINGIFFGIILYFSSEFLVTNLYNVDPLVKGYAVKCLKVLAILLWLKFFNLITITGTFRSGGDTTFAMILEIGSVWLVGIPMAYFGGIILGLPIHIVMLMYSSEEVVKLIIGIPRIVSEKWAKVLV